MNTPVESKPKILHLITRLAVGGAQDTSLLTVEKHNRTEFTVHYASNPNGFWEERARRAADKFHPIFHLIRPLHPIEDLKALWEIVQLLRREQFQVVHTHSSKAGILGRLAARIAKIPVVVHTIHGFPFNESMPAWKRQLYINLERSVGPCTDFFITVSELNRQEAAQLGLLSLDHSKTIYGGIDLVKLDRLSNPQETKHQLGIPDDWQIIVMVGRLDEQKAPYFLIDAFSQVLEACPKTVLLLVGEGELQPQLEAQTHSHGIEKNVKFLGSREDVPDILKAADIFALSSLWEGLSRAMTEAMLLGLPVVVPNIYGMPEVVKHEETGLLFPAKDVKTLANHLTDLLQNPQKRKHLGENAKLLTRKLFDAEVMVQQVEEIYRHLLSKASTR